MVRPGEDINHAHAGKGSLTTVGGILWQVNLI